MELRQNNQSQKPNIEIQEECTEGWKTVIINAKSNLYSWLNTTEREVEEKWRRIDYELDNSTEGGPLKESSPDLQLQGLKGVLLDPIEINGSCFSK